MPPNKTHRQLRKRSKNNKNIFEQNCSSDITSNCVSHQMHHHLLCQQQMLRLRNCSCFLFLLYILRSIIFPVLLRFSPVRLKMACEYVLLWALNYGNSIDISVVLFRTCEQKSNILNNFVNRCAFFSIWSLPVCVQHSHRQMFCLNILWTAESNKHPEAANMMIVFGGWIVEKKHQKKLRSKEGFRMYYYVYIQVVWINIKVKYKVKNYNKSGKKRNALLLHFCYSWMLFDWMKSRV